jgi:hypothetical protein
MQLFGSVRSTKSIPNAMESQISLKTINSVYPLPPQQSNNNSSTNLKLGHHLDKPKIQHLPTDSWDQYMSIIKNDINHHFGPPPPLSHSRGCSNESTCGLLSPKEDDLAASYLSSKVGELRRRASCTEALSPPKRFERVEIDFL